MSTKRKVLLDLAVSLDGYIEGPHGEIDWCIMEEEMAFDQFLERVDTILFGRKSYELFLQFLRNPFLSEEDRSMMVTMNSKNKVVFSRSLSGLDDARIISENLKEEVEKLLLEPGKDLWLYGGANLIEAFMKEDLVDEYRLSVHPVLLGSGKPLFTGLMERKNLQLKETKSFPSGVVQLIYEK
jgi:dihydrofolate reductase